MNKAFTLLELLIVIMIIGILSTITLQFNRGQINDMEAFNEKEQRLARHKNQNNIITNTNFINKQKISNGIEFIYTNTNNYIIQNISGEIIQYPLRNYTISWDLTITKQPLELGCTTSTPNQIELIWKNNINWNNINWKNINCFTINTNLCSREQCK